MKIIVGLGNPGREYEKTRHNVGFMALDYLRKGFEGISSCSKFNAEIYEAHIDKNSGGTEKVLLVYPQTFMNNSGEAVKAIMDFYKVEPSNLLVVHDEVDLPLGTIKTTTNSSSAGHNGVQSVIDHLGTQDFARIRIGVESRENKTQPPTESFVLQNFATEEPPKIPYENIKEKILEFTRK